MDDSDDDIPVLSGDALAALQDFYVERDKESEAFEQLRSVFSTENEKKPISISTFKEDWNASQFWFTDGTAQLLAQQLLQDSTPETAIAVVSAPSVFIQLKNLLSTGDYPQPTRICLLEYDLRFELLGDFVKYDFNGPIDLPIELKHSFDHVLCDPPYHSKPCILKYAETVKWLLKEKQDGSLDAKCKQVVCTGETMAETVLESFAGTHLSTFEPKHTARLDNRYACFVDFEFSQQLCDC